MRHMLVCRELRTSQDIESAFPLMSTLRDRIRADTFLAEVQRQQLHGYELIGGFVADRLVALAGVRRCHTLSRGEHVFVDDLVTAADEQGQGYATELLRWLAVRTGAEDIGRIYLDSRDTARGFYASRGFNFLTSIPCFIEVSQLTAVSGGEERS